MQDGQARKYELGKQLCENVFERQEDGEDPGVLEEVGGEGLQPRGKRGRDQCSEGKTTQLHIVLCLSQPSGEVPLCVQLSYGCKGET